MNKHNGTYPHVALSAQIEGAARQHPNAFVTEHGCYVIDINPRIGGGYPFSHIAGTNLTAALIAWANGQQPGPGWFRVEPNVAASQYDVALNP